MTFQNLVDKAINDSDFAQQLIDAPKETLTAAGVEPTAEMLDAINGLDVESLQKLAMAFGDKKAATV
ncbi:MAG: Os1348 family NHLP clan protein [Rhodospirillaceae bacterium]